MEGFWDLYNAETLVKLQELAAEERPSYRMDLHIHSDCSADGLQSVKRVLDRAAALNFDVISITDHDSVEAYDELQHIIRDYELSGTYLPIIVTGVEFTVGYEEYGDLCHILKYGINPMSRQIRKDLTQNELAFWHRAERQFQRISENKTLAYFTECYGLEFSYSEYKNFLSKCKVSVPEYPTLISYIHSKLNEHSIILEDIVKRLEYDALVDSCEERRGLKQQAIKRFRCKHKTSLQEADYPSRLLSPLLATVSIDDDDYPDFPSSGSLSVRNYGQLPIHDLCHEGMTIFAHPTGSKLHLIDNCRNIGGNLCGLELNQANRHANPDDIVKKAQQLNLMLTRGSDNHGEHYPSYESMEFYEAPRSELLQFIKQLELSTCKQGDVYYGKK